MNRSPNPQGKGLTPLMDSLDSCRPLVRVPAKTIEQISSELFTSLFVLESEFKFRPVARKSYWLYRRDQRFRLSLIGPHEWSAPADFGQYIGECVLHLDMTWSLALCPAAAADPRVMQLIGSRRQAFERRLQSAESVNAMLPVYEPALPFYQRAFAAGLAHSLAMSMRRGGIAGLSYAQARRRLPTPPDESDDAG